MYEKTVVLYGCDVFHRKDNKPYRVKHLFGHSQNSCEVGMAFLFIWQSYK